MIAKSTFYQCNNRMITLCIRANDSYFIAEPVTTFLEGFLRYSSKLNCFITYSFKILSAELEDDPLGIINLPEQDKMPAFALNLYPFFRKLMELAICHVPDTLAVDNAVHIEVYRIRFHSSPLIKKS